MATPESSLGWQQKHSHRWSLKQLALMIKWWANGLNHWDDSNPTEYVCMLGKYHQVGHLITFSIMGWMIKIHKNTHSPGRGCLLVDMTGSVYLTHFITMCTVSLKVHRMSCVFMSFLGKMGEKKGNCFLILPRECNHLRLWPSWKTAGKKKQSSFSVDSLSFPEDTSKSNNITQTDTPFLWSWPSDGKAPIFLMQLIFRNDAKVGVIIS